jgi:hypothetical protein
MPTLILSPRYTEDAQRLWRAASAVGWRVERLHSWRVPDDLRGVPEPVVYVEALVAPTVAEAFGLALVEPPDGWLPALPEEYRRRAVRLTTLGDARTLAVPRFVKPANDKSFAATVCLGRDLPTAFPDDAPVLVAEPVGWRVEYRLFVLDRRIVTYSIYLRDGVLQRSEEYASTPAEDAEMLRFAEAVLADGRAPLPPAVVMDVGEIWHRGSAVVELNAAWGSGLYGCDPVAVLEVLRRASGGVIPR